MQKFKTLAAIVLTSSFLVSGVISEEAVATTYSSQQKINKCPSAECMAANQKCYHLGYKYKLNKNKFLICKNIGPEAMPIYSFAPEN